LPNNPKNIQHTSIPTVSQHLIDRIAAIPNIELRVRTEIVGMSGTRTSGLESVRWLNDDTEQQETHAIRNVPGN